MRKTYRNLLALFLYIPLIAFPQQESKKVNRDVVKKMVSDSNAATFYPKLLYKLKSPMPVLSAEEYYLLYYGFVFQESYHGYSNHRKSDIVKLMNEKKYAEAEAICDSVLEKIPVSLNANYLKGLCIYLRDPGNEMAIIYRSHYEGLRDAILSSGDGKSCETAFKTIYIPDEYDIMYRYFDIEGHKGQSLQFPCDVFKIKGTKKFKGSKIYFDTSETFISMEKTLKKEK
jgi:hypothetical protein